MDTAFSPEQSAILDARFNDIDSTNASIATALANLTRQISLLTDRFDQQQQTSSSPILPTTESSPPAPKPGAQTTPPELPPQLIPTPVPTRPYPPPPSVETIEEVEQKQVYKPLRNVKQMRQHGALRRRRMRRIRDAEFFENCIAWPPKFGGTHMRFSRDEELDVWYTTMLNHRQKLIDALPNPA